MTTERPTDAEVIGALERYEAKTGDRTSALGREVVRARNSEEWFRQQWLKEQAFRAEIETQKDAEIASLRAALKPFAEFATVTRDHPRWDDSTVLASHHGREEKRVTLRISDCRAALKALEGA
jgi:hypothetical protein